MCLCTHWNETVKECIRMTEILHNNGVVIFKATMSSKARSCEGEIDKCFFKKIN